MTVCEHETLEQLIAKRDAIKDDVRNWRRLHAVVPARQGGSAAAVAEQLAVKPRSAQRWIAAYNAEGAASLADKPRSGRPPTLPAERRQELKTRLLNPTPADGDAWRGAGVRRLLEREFGVVHSLSGVYELVDRIGLSCLMPRPRHPKADPAAQEAFKKTSGGGSGR